MTAFEGKRFVVTGAASGIGTPSPNVSSPRARKSFRWTGHRVRQSETKAAGTLRIHGVASIGQEPGGRDSVWRSGGESRGNALPGSATALRGSGCQRYGCLSRAMGFETLSHRRAVLSKSTQARPDAHLSAIHRSSVEDHAKALLTTRRRQM